jgi:glycosyltransferase 2 family protein
MSRRSIRDWARIVAPVLLIATLVWRLGTGPFIAGIRSIDVATLAIAFGIGVLTTVCCAWRWTVVSAGLGLPLSLRDAVVAYYRSLFLNVTVPGGVVGDVHRGISKGREVSDVGRGLRAVVWERTSGQVVQLLATTAVLFVLPSPVRSAMPFVAAALAVAAIAVALVVRSRPDGRSAWARGRRVVSRDLRIALLARRAWPGIALASVIVVAGHALTFLIAARTVGSGASVVQMLPIALLAMMAMVLPSIGGWGPREGVTAWAFGAAGLGVHQGIATAVVYGVMAFVACLPGAAVFAVAWLRRTRTGGGEPEAETEIARPLRVHKRAVHA